MIHDKPGSLSQVPSANSSCPSRDAIVAGEWEVGLGRNSCLKSRPCHRFLSCWPDVAAGKPFSGKRTVLETVPPESCLQGAAGLQRPQVKELQPSVQAESHHHRLPGGHDP